MKVACKGHHRQEGFQEGKPRNKSEINQGQPHIIRVGQERQPYNKQCKTTQIGKQGQGHECAIQRNKNEGGGKGGRQSNQIMKEVNRHRDEHREGLAAEKQK